MHFDVWKLLAGILILIVGLAANARGQNEGANPAGVEVRVAAISFVPKKFDRQANADRLERAFREAKAGGAQLAVAPEGALEGYVVNEIIAGKAKAEQMKEVAVPIDHPLIQRFRQLARELNMSLVFGFAERIGEEVFNCALFIDPQGKIRGKHHKTQLAEGYHPSWWFNRLGNQCRAFDTPYGRCGILICNERWNPQLARILALDGARFLVVPAFGSRSKSQDETVLNRGKENGIPVVEANVGVTLVVDDGKIAAVDRREEGITFGRITVPPPVAPQAEKRDELEKEYLRQREETMRIRYEKTIQRLREKARKEQSDGKVQSNGKE
jgi:predicted amidohydrolase